MDSFSTLVYRHEPAEVAQKVTGHNPPVTVLARGTRASPVPPVHFTGPETPPPAPPRDGEGRGTERLLGSPPRCGEGSGVGFLLFGSGLAAVLCLASPAAAQIPGLGGGPKAVPDVVENEPPEGTLRPAAPDQRTGHVYVAFGVSANGPAGAIVSTVGSSQDMGTGVTGSGLVGVGLGRHGSLQLFGDGTYFTSPGSCISGCS